MEQKTRTRRYFIGNILIIVSLISTLSIVLPLIVDTIKFHFFPAPTVASDIAYSITIPALKIASPITAGVDPFNKADYTRALEHGVAEATGSGVPGDHNTIYLFAHSSGNPWEQTYTNTPFYRLNNIKINNIITLQYHGTSYTYKVISTKIVSPQETSYLTASTTDELILQTCWPVGTDWKRLLVFATPVN